MLLTALSDAGHSLVSWALGLSVEGADNSLPALPQAMGTEQIQIKS